MSLEHLDDANPPALDADRWQWIQRRSRALARRRRATAATSVAAGGLVLAIVAVGVAVVGRNHGDGIAAVATTPSTTTRDRSAWVTVELHVDHRTVAQGADVTGTVVFVNHRSVRVVLGSTRWQVLVGSRSARPIAPDSDRYPWRSVDLPPGTTTVAFRAANRDAVNVCSQQKSSLACPGWLRAGPAMVWFVTEGPVEHLALPAPVAITIAGRGGPAPSPLPCPVPSPKPSMATGSFCGPAPTRGNGLGPNGECTGRETAPPCGPGAVPGQYYAFTMPGTCDGRVVFDGRHWISELPPDHPVPDFYVWISIGTNRGVGWIGPNGAVGFTPDTGQPVLACGSNP